MNGDSDSIACIAGSIGGAYLEMIEAIPNGMEKNLYHVVTNH